MEKQTPTPTNAIRMPPTLGPTTRARLNIMEFSEMAWRKSSLPTICTVMAWRMGTSKALMNPWNSASATICQTWIKWVSVRIASAADCRQASDWVMNNSRRLSKRSAMAPPNAEKKNTGTEAAKEVTPKISGEWVRL